MDNEFEVPDYDKFMEEIDFNNFDLEDFLDRFQNEYKIKQQEGRVGYSGEAASILEFLFETYTYVYDIDTGWVIEGATLVRLYNEILNIHEVVKEFDENTESEFDDIEREIGEHVFRTKASDKILLFFTLATEVINGLSMDLIIERVIHNEHRNKSSRRFIENLNQHDREELLFRTGTIDGELKGMMADIRQTRNSLTHDLRERHLLESIDNILSEIANVIETVDRLHSRVEGYSLTFKEK